MEFKYCSEVRRGYTKITLLTNNLQDLGMVIQEMTMRNATGFFIKDNKEGEESNKRKEK